MKKHNEQINKGYLDKVEQYISYFKKWKIDSILLNPFFAGSEKELYNKTYEKVAKHEMEDLEVVMEMCREDFCICWSGQGYYDIQAISDGLAKGEVRRIEDIIEMFIDDMYNEMIYYPDLIEEQLNGKVYAVYCDAADGITIKCTIVDDRKDIDDGIEGLVNILEKQGIKLHANNKYQLERVTQMDEEMLERFLNEYLGFEEDKEEIKTVYLSKIGN